MKKKQEDEMFVKLAQDLLDKMYEYKGSESRRAIVSDKILLGLLININAIFSSRKSICKHFAKEKYKLVERCLFFYGAKEKINEMKVTEEMLKT